MNLILRKFTYAILGSGALGSGLLAVMGLTVSIGVFATRSDEMSFTDNIALILAIAACAGGIVGPIAGIATVIALPVKTAPLRLTLTCGIVAGCISTAPVITSWIGEGDVTVMLYVAVLPLLVGLALLAELWRPQRSVPKQSPAAAQASGVDVAQQSVQGGAPSSRDLP